MTNSRDTLDVNVIVEISAPALQAIVANAKALAGRNAKGHYQVDTADKVGQLISRFLREKDFDAFVREIENYT